MFIRRLVIRNLRNFEHLDLRLGPGVTQITGENNTGKTNLLHAIRLVLDARLPSGYRSLQEHDIYAATDISEPQQVIVSVELADFVDDDNAQALVAEALLDEQNVARIHYRFRPRQSVREELGQGTRDSGALTLGDYHWEITGGGQEDPATVEWNEDLGSSLRFQSFQNYQVTLLPALRDVNQDLRRSRASLLHRMIESSDLTDEAREELLTAVVQANDLIEDHSSVQEAGTAVKRALDEVAGEAFTMDVRVGVSEPSLSSVLRSLTLLLSDTGVSDFDTARNGLGINNLLYIGMLLELFDRQSGSPDNAGQLLLVEEPEAHLHPQLQRVLFTALAERDLQTIVTTHSTHVSSRADIESLVVLSKAHRASVTSVALGSDDVELPEDTKRDLERYLDATRSELLFARRVMLVEGPSEAFLIPVMAREVLGIDLDRLGIAVLPIYGTHFHVYAALFGEDRIRRKCAIVADGDLRPSDATEPTDEEETLAVETSLMQLENEFVKVFQNRRTFERSVTRLANLPMLISTADHFGATRTSQSLVRGRTRLASDDPTTDEKAAIRDELRSKVLNLARRVGKARFAQVASGFVTSDSRMPSYIRSAIDWLTTEDENS